jgi:lipoprotein-anchoring transpeptidase ErfK/SrfK
MIADRRVFALYRTIRGAGEWTFMKTLNRLVAMFACALVAGSVSVSANAQGAQAAQGTRQNAPSFFTTPFGIIYKIHARETVPYTPQHTPGTVVVNTRERYLYYVLGGGQALRYNIGVGKEGRTFAGVSTISAKREWPDWSPTPNIKKEQPDLPNHMKGGEGNPLGARALYLGSTLYRIHGTNEPWKIGDGVSSGCIRLTNDDVIDLYNRVKIGATVIVQR